MEGSVSEQWQKTDLNLLKRPLKRQLFSLRSNGPRYARVGSLWDAGTVVATLQRPSIRSGRVLLRRGNCFRCAQTALASLGMFFAVLPRDTVLAPLERPSLRSGTSGTQELLSLRSNIPRFARGGSLWDARTVFATLKQPSLRSGRFSPFRLGSLLSLRSNDPRYARGPPSLTGIYLDLLGCLRNISGKPRSKFQKSEKNRVSAKISPYMRRKRETLLGF